VDEARGKGEGMGGAQHFKVGGESLTSAEDSTLHQNDKKTK